MCVAVSKNEMHESVTERFPVCGTPLNWGTSHRANNHSRLGLQIVITVHFSTGEIGVEMTITLSSNEGDFSAE